MYSSQLLHYFQQPQHSGELPQANSRATMGSQEEGRLLVFAVEIQGKHVRAARFQAQGCPVTIACGEYAANWIEGKELSDAKTFSSDILLEALEIPPHKHYCALMTEDVLHQTISQFQEGDHE